MSNLSLRAISAGSRIPAVAVPRQATRWDAIAESFAAAAVMIDRKLIRATDLLLEWQRRQRDRAALRAMDDRTLLDIGLSRADVEAEINKHFWQG